jgi:hypothetical protein
VLGSSPQADTVWYRKILEYRVDRESRSGTAARWPNQAQMYSCCAWSGSAKRKSFTFDTRKLFLETPPRCRIVAVRPVFLRDGPVYDELDPAPKVLGGRGVLKPDRVEHLENILGHDVRNVHWAELPCVGLQRALPGGLRLGTAPGRLMRLDVCRSALAECLHLALRRLLGLDLGLELGTRGALLSEGVLAGRPDGTLCISKLAGIG